MLALVLDQLSNDNEKLPPAAVAAISAGVHISTQEIKELLSSDVEKSLTQAPVDAPMFERGAYLNPEPAKDWADSARKEDQKNEVLDAETRVYMIKMHQAANSFKKELDKQQTLKGTPEHSNDDLEESQALIRKHAMRFAQLSEISTHRLEERASTLSPSLVSKVKLDTELLHKDMDQSFKTAIKNGDLILDNKEASRLGNTMASSEKHLSSLDNAMAHDNNLLQNNRSINEPVVDDRHSTATPTPSHEPSM